MEKTAEDLDGREYSCGVIAFFWARASCAGGASMAPMAPRPFNPEAVDCKVDYLSRGLGAWPVADVFGTFDA